MKSLKVLSFIALAFILVTGCKKESKDNLSEQIHNIVPDSILNAMKSLGMPVHGGVKPPDLQNTYLASPFVLKSSNIADDYIGSTFSDFYFKFSEQNNENLSVKLDYYNSPETGTGLGGFISGSDNSFSAFFKVSSTANGDPADLIMVISGTISDGAVKNFYYANFMLNNYGNPHGYWISQGDGRVIYDSDGNSPTVEGFPVKGAAVPESNPVMKGGASMAR
jgi:hypothetical protein